VGVVDIIESRFVFSAREMIDDEVQDLWRFRSPFGRGRAWKEIA